MSYLPGETIILKLRRHPIAFFFDIFFYLILLAVPPVAGFFLSQRDYQFPSDELSAAALVLGLSIYYLYILLFIFYSFFDYFLDEWIVTDQHILNIEQRGLFYRSIAKEELHRVQDITVVTKGLFPTLFNYGDILVQTAAEKEQFIFHQIPDPQSVVEIISKLLQKNKSEEESPDLIT